MSAFANNKALVLRLIDEVLCKGNLAATDQLLDANFVLHFPGSPEPIRGVEGLKRVAENFLAGFPDRHVIVEDVICEGDKLAVRITQQGTHKGVFQGIAPTGKQVSVTGIAIFRVVNGKIAEEWLSSDRLGLIQQLGAVPEPASRRVAVER